jgi:hypothetical protein
MNLTDEQAQFYRQTLEIARKSIDELNVQIEEELAKVKQIYDGACKILGVENELEKVEEPEA